ncbi:MAG TPA: hypothetical protein VEX15_16625 [Nocardioidaceae bacterium]|nr:hypothetical protein [Nocardioidaceae bacterium]
MKVTTIPLARVPRVSAGLIGGNHRWLDDAGGVLNPDGTLNASILTLSKRLGLKSVRYPGGTVANLFSWRHDDTSPGCQTSGGYIAEAFAPISASRSGYTIAKHARFLSAVSARTNLMIPMINTSPREARQFVLSVVKHTGARRLTVEVGNEPMYRAQHYWRSAHSKQGRLTQYIDGGRRTQGPGNVVLRDAGYNGLFNLRGCDLRHPVRANGAANQVYRTRYVPISTRMTPQIRIQGRPWRYVKSLRNAGSRHVFTITRGGTRIRFGDGHGNGARPEGRMRIDPNHPYVAARQPGFRDFYRALKRLVGTRGITKINVCSAWSSRGFVNAMDARGARYDCLAAHLPATLSGVHTAPAVNIALQRRATRHNSRLLSWRRAERDSPVAGAHRRFVIVTEYGVAHTSFAGLGRKFVSTMYRDRLLMGQVRAGVPIGNIYGVNALFWRTGTDSAGDKLYALSSTARMLSLWRRTTGRQPVRVRCGGCTVPGNVKIMATRKGRTATLMMLNIGAASSKTWSPRFAVANRGGDSCITVRRMRAGLDATDLPTRTGGPVPSMRPVLVQKWPAGTAFPNDTGLRSIFAHSIELMTISPTTNGCSTPKF